MENTLNDSVTDSSSSPTTTTTTTTTITTTTTNGSCDIANLNGDSKKQSSRSPPPFLVLELFISEGCSSSPAADGMLQALRTTYLKPVTRLYALHLHVDYWNNDGHVDKFSTPQSGLRQQWYSKRIFNLDKLFTPQFVINGASEMIGNDLKALRKKIAALDIKEEVPVNLKADWLDDKTIKVSHKVGETQVKGAVLHLVAVEDGPIESKIEAGNNKGQVFKQVDIVRGWCTVAVKTGQQEEETHNILDVKVGEKDKVRVVGFVQSMYDGTVVGANDTAIKGSS